jgi:hypothetical protein
MKLEKFDSWAQRLRNIDRCHTEKKLLTCTTGGVNAKIGDWIKIKFKFLKYF